MSCRLFFSVEETDPFCKMMPHRSDITEGRESEPVFKVHIPFSGNAFKDRKREPFKAISGF